jgi:hypothetical protein
MSLFEVTAVTTDRVQGSGFGVQGSGFGVQGSGFGVQGSGLRVQGSGFGVPVQGSTFQFAESQGGKRKPEP